MIILICSEMGFAVELSKFKYLNKAKVDCTNFIGYANIDLATDILYKSDNLKNFYINSEYFIERGSEIKTSNWYVQDTSFSSIDYMNRILDYDKESYISVEKPNYKLEIKLKNPNLQKFNKIMITLKDSELRDVEFYNSKGVKLNPHLIRSNFGYEYLFETLETDFIEIIIYFKNIIKLSDISMYYTEPSKVYFFVNNECGRTYSLYYGGYGGNEIDNYAKHAMTKIMPSTLLEESQNPKYISDFDNDNVLNGYDNCINVANTDQQDFNYNGIGDACEDFDNDGIMNSKDNCPEKYNPLQTDKDNDSKGDECDTNDDRFSEQNKVLFYIGAVIAIFFFIYFAYLLTKKK